MERFYKSFILDLHKEGVPAEEIASQVPYTIKDVQSTIYSNYNKPDAFDPLDGLAYVLEQANKAVEEAQEAKKNNPIPLLTIELEDMNSVPVVKYKGEELGHKTYVKFDWEQKTDKSFGGVEFDIEHHVSKAKQNEIGHFNTIKKSSTFKGSSM
ncbi:hypothetical protein [Oceanobacillus jeddahense]|uniref:hypothetical protein n=1 Tax=Oceanobacillus jeddahense TaxID=1462527 RepID=UPI00363A429A